MTSDPLDELFELENTFYKEGYDLGVQDGNRTGRIEGRLFGLEKGFEKFITMGQMHGRSVIWSSRLSSNDTQITNPSIEKQAEAPAVIALSTQKPSSDDISNSTIEGVEQEVSSQQNPSITTLPRIPQTTRLEKHIRSLYALTEPASLSTENNEDSISEFEDRLKRAEGKFKIIERLVGEENDSSEVQDPSKLRGEEGGIEDIDVRGARR